MHLRTKIIAGIVAITALAITNGVIAGSAPLAIAAGGLGLVLVGLLWGTLGPLLQITTFVEEMAGGDLRLQRLEVNSNDEFGRLATSLNQLLTQLRGFSDEADELADGYIGVRHLEEKVMETGRLSEVDFQIDAHQGDLNRSFTALTNQLRRLTIQARIISNDQLYNEALDERLPGELGEAFGAMFENLRMVATRARAIASGDLTSYVDGEGDLHGAFNDMVTGLTELVHRIMQSALGVSSSVEQILVVLRSQESAAFEQSSHVRQTRSTMEKVLGSANRIAESAEKVSEAAERTHRNHQINAEHITELTTHIERIDEILKLIQSIADRSDLLALNASLEGGHAGAAGRGFKLIAREIRQLAENIKTAVVEIQDLLRDIRVSSRTSVETAEEGKRLSESTTKAALAIKDLTERQRGNTEEVSRAMEELAQSIHQGVHGTREVTTAVSDLASLSEQLRSMVERFHLDTSLIEDLEDERAELPERVTRAGRRPVRPGLTAGGAPS
jgi:methyl-accepting chemotaxis protein